MNWSLCWSEIAPNLCLPAICQRNEDGVFVNFVPLLLFDIKVLQIITDHSAASLTQALQSLQTEAMNCDQTAALNQMLRNDCVCEFGDLQLDPGPDQLAPEKELRVLTEKVVQLRHFELTDIQWPTLVPIVMKIQSGWFTLNDCHVPFVHRGPTLLVPRGMMLKACNATEIEKVQGWVASAAETFLMTSLLRQRHPTASWEPNEQLLGLQQMMIIFKHKIFNGPKIHGDGFSNISVRGDQTCVERKPVVVEVRVADRNCLESTTAVNSRPHNLLPKPFSLLLVRSLEVLSVEPSLSVTFCMAHLQTTDSHEPVVSIPCFYRCLASGVACVFIEEVRRQFFSRWSFLTLLHSLRRFINHSKFICAELPILHEYNRVLPNWEIEDLPQSVELRALLASLMLVRMEYRASMP